MYKNTNYLSNSLSLIQSQLNLCIKISYNLFFKFTKKLPTSENGLEWTNPIEYDEYHFLICGNELNRIENIFT